MGKKRNSKEKNELMFLLHSPAAFQYLNAGFSFNIFEHIKKTKKVSFKKLQLFTKLSKSSFECLIFGLLSLNLIKKKGKKNYGLSSKMKILLNSDFYNVFKPMVKFQSEIAYLGQYKFIDSLKRGENLGIDFISGQGKTLYEKFNSNKRIKNIFYEYMEVYSNYSINLLLQNVVFFKNENILDIGGGKGANSFEIISRYPTVNIKILELSFLKMDLNEKILKKKFNSNISFQKTDIFKDEFPKGTDTILFIHQLVIWSKQEIEILLKKAFDALNLNGRIIIFSSISNNNFKGPKMAALDSVYFKSIATGRGMIYNWNHYSKILKKTGFKKIRNKKFNDWTPHGLIEAYK